MSCWHNYYPDEHAFFCTVTVTDWQPALVGDARRVLYEEWEAARRVLGVRILAYCVMPNHVHLLLWSERGTAVRDFLHLVASCISCAISRRRILEGAASRVADLLSAGPAHQIWTTCMPIL